MRGLLFVSAATLLLTACGRPPTGSEQALSPIPTPTATPEPGFVGVAEPSPAIPASELIIEAVTTPEMINLDAADAENRAVKIEVLDRIDRMPNLSEDERDKLYVQVERARGMGKVITIPFASGGRNVVPTFVSEVVKAVQKPQIQKFLEDPTVVFVVLGYADKKGRSDVNQEISLARAEAVVDVLKERAGVKNVVHAVGMGSSDLFDAAKLDKNRVVEVWAVLP